MRRPASSVLAGQRLAPRLRLVRASDPPPLEFTDDIEGEVLPRLPVAERWQDSVWFGFVIVGLLLGLALALGVVVQCQHPMPAFDALDEDVEQDE